MYRRVPAGQSPPIRHWHSQAKRGAAATLQRHRNRCLAFALVVSLWTGLCFGVLPAWRAARLNSAKALSGAGGGIPGRRREHHLHASLVVAETAISLILLAGSGLLIRSFLEMTKVNPGFDPHHTIRFRVGMSVVAYPEEQAPLFFRYSPLSRDRKRRPSPAGGPFATHRLPPRTLALFPGTPIFRLASLP